MWVSFPDKSSFDSLTVCFHKNSPTWTVLLYSFSLYFIFVLYFSKKRKPDEFSWNLPIFMWLLWLFSFSHILQSLFPLTTISSFATPHIKKHFTSESIHQSGANKLTTNKFEIMHFMRIAKIRRIAMKNQNENKILLKAIWWLSPELALACWALIRRDARPAAAPQTQTLHKQLLNALIKGKTNMAKLAKQVNATTNCSACKRDWQKQF